MWGGVMSEAEEDGTRSELQSSVALCWSEYTTSSPVTDPVSPSGDVDSRPRAAGPTETAHLFETGHRITRKKNPPAGSSTESQGALLWLAQAPKRGEGEATGTWICLCGDPVRFCPSGSDWTDGGTR